jgi:hypothetical protein
MLPVKFGSIWPSSLIGEDFFNITQSEKRIALAGHVCLWLPRAILVSDWLMLSKSSPLKLLGQMEPNLAGNIYVRYSIKLLQSETRIALGSHICWPNGTKRRNFIEDLT